ncbi:MAG: glycogen/starch/alpha-glucan phosphorylase [Ruminococcaceae bacterium]|nr:glycogen/starch/alpha-glucan phosphorylase [Oscillospiraceae bacterium]
MTVKNIKTNIETKLARSFGCSIKEASKEQLYRACALTVRDILSEKRQEFKTRVNEKAAKRVYYMCMEFLVGRSLKTNLCNLALDKMYEEAIGSTGYTLEDLYTCEPDAGLGNGGLGRLAACFMDSLSSLDYPATGFSICYEYGLFKQKIIDGTQVELPDNWLPGGDVWLVPRTDRTFRVRFGGQIKESWDNGRLEIIYENADEIKAVPYDMMMSGADSDAVSQLRLWKAEDIDDFNMNLFAEGQYRRALEKSVNAEIICKVLYPSDNHYEGKLLRLTQQYFMVSASCQSIIRDHMAVYGNIRTLADKAAVHINDTHPALCVPEIMRILMDDYCLGWDEAWGIVSRMISYTNHTVLPEALETWNESLFALWLPRIHMIVKEINERFCRNAWEIYPGNWDKISDMAVISNGVVRMANLAIVASHHINGVAEIHSNILKDSTFKSFYRMWPEKFDNVTNGVAHRRWLCYSNPELAELISDCIGDSYRKDPAALAGLRRFAEDKSVLSRLEEIKKNNKMEFAAIVKERTGEILDPATVFDVQIKRLHEYKRQLLNAMHIIGLYQELKADPNADILPRTFIFGAKAAPGYRMAKEIIKLIWCLGEEIKKDKRISEKLCVLFMEDYNVTLAEKLVPAAEISEQISLAGKEASGTGCMKLMLNGALTIGTADGANIEMAREAGEENMFMFGLTAPEADDLRSMGYRSADYYNGNEKLQYIVNSLNAGYNGQSFSHLSEYLLVHDPYMCMADFESYRHIHEKASKTYSDREKWNRMALMNIAGAGKFAADRSINEYAERIWNIERMIKE